MIRSFIGIPIPGATARALEPLQGGLPAARAVPPEYLHLTLAFLGDQPEAVVRTLAAELDTIHAHAFQIRLSGLMLLGGKRPGAVAVGADGGTSLDRLRAKIARRVRECDIPLDRRKFRPHVTILRLSGHSDVASRQLQDWIDRIGPIPEIQFSAKDFCLYRSILKRSGAEYECLCDYPLL